MYIIAVEIPGVEWRIQVIVDVKYFLA